MNSEEFLQGKFREHYERAEVQGPPEINRREFGIGKFGIKIAQRHLGFKNQADLNLFLRENAPFYISYSLAYYQLPEAKPMEAKKFIASDLIFEFDADDLKTRCKEKHDSWKCQSESCGAEGKGHVKACTNCGSGTKIDEWTCPECLNATREQTKKLLKIFNDDFGIEKGLSINFSGSKGYHLHVRPEEILSLPQKARVELTDYLTLNSLSYDAHGFSFDGKMFSCPKEPKGIGKRFLQGLIKLINDSDLELLATISNLSLKDVKGVICKKDLVLDYMTKGVLFQLPGKKTEKFWLSLLDYVKEKIKLNLDRQTSIDIRRIIRVPDTIHGSTGLIAKTVDDLDSFNPFKDSIVFSEKPFSVNLEKNVSFELNDQQFDIPSGIHKLPEYLAVYLIAKGKAEPKV